MKKDIDFKPVENVLLAIVPENGGENEGFWNVYIINRNEENIDNVLVSSKGYGEKDGEKQSTSVLRHFIEGVKAGDSEIIEPIDPKLFHLFNEYWVSYYIGKQIYDKKFIFVPGSISKKNISRIDPLEKEGVLHS